MMVLVGPSSPADGQGGRRGAKRKDRFRKWSSSQPPLEHPQHQQRSLPASASSSSTGGHLTNMIAHRKRGVAAPQQRPALDAAIIAAIVFFPCLLTLVSGTPKAIDLHDIAQLDAHSPNYCNDTKACDDAGLLRSPLGQFLGYPCSAEFFHCRWQSDGYRTYKKLCRTGLVYDVLGTQNCNYDYAVEGCNERKPEKCNAEDFACPLSEKCVKMSQRCDGKYDCMLEEDEQNCPMCKPKEFPCVVSEQCIPISGRCNGIKECEDGSDEQNCDVCGKGQFFCRKSGKCIPGKERCDGKAQCPAGEDEMLCKKTAFRMYVCENGIRVPRDRVCDGTKHCPDGSDEKYCNKPIMPIVKGIFGGDAAADEQSGAATDEPKVSASFPLVEFHGASDSSPEKAAAEATTPATASAAAQADESQPSTTEAAAAGTSAAPETTAAEEQQTEAEAATEATPGETATESAAEETTEAPSEAEVTTGEAATTDAEATTAEATTEEAGESEEPSTETPVTAHHAKMKKYPFVNPWAKTPVPAGGSSSSSSEEAPSPAAATTSTSETITTTTAGTTTPRAMSTTQATTPATTTTTRCPHNSYTVAIQAAGYGSSMAACAPEPPASTDIPEYVGRSGRKQFIPAYKSTEATQAPQTSPMGNSVDDALLKILSAKYGTNSKDLLKKIERMLESEKNTTTQASHDPKARAYYRHLPAKTIRVTGRPAHKWKPSLSSDVSRTTPRPLAQHSTGVRRRSSKGSRQEGDSGADCLDRHRQSALADQQFDRIVDSSEP